MGSLTPVTVIDGRGSLEGWTATVRLISASGGGRVQITPDPPRAVTGKPSEVAEGLPSTVTTAPVVIGYASGGGGGGTFVLGGQITIKRGARAGGGDVTVELFVTVQ